MRPLISRLIGPFIAAFVIWLGAKGIPIDNEFASALTEAVVLLVLATFTALSGLSHRLIDRKVNPADRAVP
jgi:hypothetical protein